MSHDGQVVRLTRCENVAGFPALFAAALSSQGCYWYPEYTVYEEYRDFGLSTFYCEVEVRDLAGDQIFYHAAGRGMTPEDAVQEAAYYALTLYRQECPYLGFDNSPFRYFPGAVEGNEGIYVGTYADASQEDDPRIRCMAYSESALDHRGRYWHMYFLDMYLRQWDTMVAL